MNIIRIDKCLSTNSFLKELSDKQPLEEGTVIATKEQLAGRGQAGNQWESEPGKNLTFSILFCPDFLSVKENFLLSKGIALGVKEVLDTYTRDISIKWPNDIYYKDKKIAGILIENNITGKILSRAVAGIGINVNQAVFHSDAPNPVSLKQITGMETDLNELLEQISCAVLSRYQQLKDGETNRITEDYHRALYRKAGFYPYKVGETSFFAKIESVANDGFLHLITEEGERHCYAFKEVRFVAQNQ